jgi:hypothetical protein
VDDRQRSRLRLRRFAIAASVSTIAAAAVWYLVGPRAGVAVGVVGYLTTAWRSDGDLGYCFVFAVLALLIVVILAMALVGSVMINR